MNAIRPLAAALIIGAAATFGTAAQTPVDYPASFKVIAPTLNTTAEALGRLFGDAKRNYSALSPAEFLVANLLQRSLADRFPRVMAPRLIDGLKEGRTFAQMLRAMGVPDPEAPDEISKAQSLVKRAERLAAE